MQHSDTTELHPFVKASIAYMGIMAGFAVLGLTFYVVAARGEAVGSSIVPPEMYYTSVAYYVMLAGASVFAVWLLKSGRRVGAYLAFAILGISLLEGSGFAVVYWFAIPNAAVGILLLKAYKTLH